MPSAPTRSPRPRSRAGARRRARRTMSSPSGSGGRALRSRRDCPRYRSTCSGSWLFSTQIKRRWIPTAGSSTRSSRTSSATRWAHSPSAISRRHSGITPRLASSTSSVEFGAANSARGAPSSSSPGRSTRPMNGFGGNGSISRFRRFACARATPRLRRQQAIGRPALRRGSARIPRS